MNLLTKNPLSIICFFIIIWGLSSCDCKIDEYECPDFSKGYSNMLETINQTNFIFESDSGKRILLKMTETVPTKDKTQSCKGTRNNCQCNPCTGINYFEIQAIDTSEVAQFWHFTFTNTFDYDAGQESSILNFELVTFETSTSFPIIAGGNVQSLGDLTLSGKKYENVYRVEIKDKNSVNDLAFVMINETHGIIGFKELESEEIFYRL